MKRPTVKVRMNATAQGAPDSTTVRTYEAGREYEVPEDLAECFFSTGAADPAEAHTEADAADAAPPSPEAGKTAQRKRRAAAKGSEA